MKPVYPFVGLIVALVGIVILGGAALMFDSPFSQPDTTIRYEEREECLEWKLVPVEGCWQRRDYCLKYCTKRCYLVINSEEHEIGCPPERP